MCSCGVPCAAPQFLSEPSHRCLASEPLTQPAEPGTHEGAGRAMHGSRVMAGRDSYFEAPSKIGGPQFPPWQETWAGPHTVAEPPDPSFWAPNPELQGGAIRQGELPEGGDYPSCLAALYPPPRSTVPWPVLPKCLPRVEEGRHHTCSPGSYDPADPCSSEAPASYAPVRLSSCPRSGVGIRCQVSISELRAEVRGCEPQFPHLQA